MARKLYAIKVGVGMLEKDAAEKYLTSIHESIKPVLNEFGIKYIIIPLFGRQDVVFELLAEINDTK